MNEMIEEKEVDIKNIRPSKIDEYIGQTEVKENMKIFIEAAKMRGESLDHVLLYGPPGLGIAHSMAHTLGAVYDTPHGVACAMMLPIVMEYNADCTGEKYREIARAMGVKGVDDMSVEEYRKAAIDAVAQLSVDVGIPTKLEAIKEDDLDFLAESAHADACAPGNPKDASVEDLKALFRKIM